MNKKGFTLIELLVVVLIIGILSSVALPQYQKTVLKSRAAEAWSTLGTIRTAVDAYCLENPSGSGWYSSLKDSLPVEIQNSNSFSYNGYIDCSVTSASSGHSEVYAGYSKGGVSFVLSINQKGQRVCKGSASGFEKHCRDLGFKNTGSGAVCFSRGGNACGATCYYMD